MAREFPKQEDNSSNIGFFFLIIYTIALFVRPQEWSYNPDPFPIARIFLILSFSFYILAHRPKVMGYQGWLLVAMVLLIPLSGLRNYNFGEGFYQAQNFFIYSIVPFLLFASLASTQKKQNYIFFIMAIACTVMLHHGISQILSPEGIGWSGELLSQGTRITFLGFFNDPNDLGMFFLMNIPIVYYLRSTIKSSLVSFALFVLTIGLVYGIFLTNSRGALVGFMALLVTYFYFRYGKIKTFFMVLVMTPIAFIVMTLFRTIDSQEESANDRISAWYEGIQMFKYRPLFGIGKGQFVEAHGLTAHNSYVLIWAELGTLGYLLWFMTISLTVVMLYKIMSLKTEIYKKQPEIIQDIFLARCLLLSFVGFLTTAFFLSRTYVVFLYVFLGISFALIYRVKKQVNELNEFENGKLLMQLATLGFISLIALYIIITILL
jgi:O-antigen ligase